MCYTLAHNSALTLLAWRLKHTMLELIMIGAYGSDIYGVGTHDVDVYNDFTYARC